MKRILLCLLAVMTVACGAESPTAPPASSNPQETAVPIAVFSLRNGEPVPGAQVTVSAETVSIQTSGFLSRISPYQPGMNEFLWPSDEQLPEWFTWEIVYDSGQRELYRPEPGLMAVIPEAFIWNEPKLLRAIQDGIDHINGADDHIEWQMVRSGTGADGEISIEINPEDPLFIEYPGAGGLAIVTVRGNTIIRGRVLFRSAEYGADWMTSATAHELGHIRGLGHVRDPATVMGGSLHQFSDREREVMRYMMRRPPGTRWPDDTTGIASATSKRPTLRLVCVF
ncbi:MAG: hypothetical protein Q8P35_02130 [Candidatus Yanofskybacteria bacterium]|nr:hypothetical protein [Candidatus Yanofskybacteria bacterium]